MSGRRLRVLFASTRGEGHLRPLLPFIDACRDAGHEVLVFAPPPLEQTLTALGHPFRLAVLPDQDELRRLWGRILELPRAESDRLRVREMFADLNVRAGLERARSTLAEWRPDVVVREPFEFASAVAADEAGIAHAQVGIDLQLTYTTALAAAEPSLERWSRGLTERIRTAPYLTTYPASLDAPDQPGLDIHRFRRPRSGEPPRALPDWWPGNDLPLVYVTFGTVTGRMPRVRPVYGAALEAVEDLPARVLIGLGGHAEIGARYMPGPNVRMVDWVPERDVLREARLMWCHAGSGTVLAALAEGLPLVVTPLFAMSQPHVAAAVERRGVGVSVAPRIAHPLPTELDPAAARHALDAVLEDPSYAAAARAVAEEMRALPEPAAAAGLLANLK